MRVRGLLVAACVASIGAVPRVASEAHQRQGGAPAVMQPRDLQALPARPADHRVAYGEDPNQFAELRLPAGAGPHPVAVLIHGGCWKAEYATLRDLGPMGDALKEEGIASWNIEYRRGGHSGGGFPGTYQDVGRAIDRLREAAPEHNLDLARVAVIGHSAGGHLAMWAGMRQRLSPQSLLYIANPLRLRGVINLAGTIDMRENIARMESMCRDTVVTKMLGGTPSTVGERYRDVSATDRVPLGIPQILVWGEHEDFVPRPLAERHVDAAVKAGDRARLIVVPAAGHFESASPTSSAWPVVLQAIRSLLAN
jgi:acetyl esterase/lipase